VLTRDAPANAVQLLLHKVAPVNLKLRRVGRGPHLAPGLASCIHVPSVLERALGAEFVEAILDGLVMRERLEIVHEELKVVEAARGDGLHDGVGVVHRDEKQGFSRPAGSAGPPTILAERLRRRALSCERQAARGTKLKHELAFSYFLLFL
jgi:hypothetical protein